MPDALGTERDRRVLNVLLEMARLDAMEARSPAAKHHARRQADELLDDWLKNYGRPTDA